MIDKNLNTICPSKMSVYSVRLPLKYVGVGEYFTYAYNFDKLDFEPTYWGGSVLEFGVSKLSKKKTQKDVIKIMGGLVPCYNQKRYPDDPVVFFLPEDTMVYVSSSFKEDYYKALADKHEDVTFENPIKGRADVY